MRLSPPTRGSLGEVLGADGVYLAPVRAPNVL